MQLISHEFISEELAKHGLSEAVYSGCDNSSTLDIDYFLRLINCSVLLAEQV